QIPNFLSDDEIKQIGSAAVVPRCVSLHREDVIIEQSVSSSMDCSSVTYFPEVSDVEPQLLEIGWPASLAHFQPSYGECIYSYKEAARIMIKSAKEIINCTWASSRIFRRRACTWHRVPVYILLDHSCVPTFLKMCNNINVRLDELRQTLVRTITGGTYFMRSGAKITGKVNERFMLIDGNRVATGSYSSNLIELSGQITENFDEEFRFLYAKSMPVITRGPASARNSGIYDHLLIKHPATSSPQPARERTPVEPVCLEVLGKTVCLTITPSRAQAVAVLPPREETGERGRKSSPVSESSTIGEDWMERQHMQEILAGSAARCLPTGDPATVTVAVDVLVTPPHSPSCLHPDQLPHGGQWSADRSDSAAPHLPWGGPLSCNLSLYRAPDGNLRECFHKLTKERQYHYSTIRSKLEHMVTMLSHRRELVNLNNMALGPGLHRAGKGPERAETEAGA
ncbi:unnamed protein product, partial [Coregonus sp. 'balchen']